MPENLLKFFSRHRQPLSRATIFIWLAVSILVILTAPVATDASGSLTSVKDTLSTSRPSVYTTVAQAISVGDTTINVGSTLGIVQGDTITVCNSTCSTSEAKVVASVINSTQLGLTVGTTNSYTTSGIVLFKQTATHTITFTTRSTVSGGKFVITIPATNTTTPTTTGFALNGISTSTDVTLTGGTAGTISTSTSGSNILINIPFTGSIASSTSITITIGVSTLMLNPTKTAAQGTADTWNVEADEDDGTGNLIDTTTVKVGTIEAVTVSATVAPSLTFSINAVAASTSVTAHSTSVATTATTVPFGTLTVNASSTAAQYVHIDTNSNSGYNVTVQQDGSLRKTNGTAVTDFSTTAAEQDGNAGFGYSLQSKAGSPTMAFNYNDAGAKFKAAGFSSTTAVSIMSNSAPANGDEGYIDYYVKVTATQAQGTYQNRVTFIATPIF